MLVSEHNEIVMSRGVVWLADQLCVQHKTIIRKETMDRALTNVVTLMPRAVIVTRIYTQKTRRLKDCQTHRSLYGLRQAGRCWNNQLVKQLKAIGFEQSRADRCIFRIREGHEVTIMLAVHVDDMVIAGSRNICDTLLKILNEMFPV